MSRQQPRGLASAIIASDRGAAQTRTGISTVALAVIAQTAAVISTVSTICLMRLAAARRDVTLDARGLVIFACATQDGPASLRRWFRTSWPLPTRPTPPRSPRPSASTASVCPSHSASASAPNCYPPESSARAHAASAGLAGS
jgi:hypothetical protein